MTAQEFAAKWPDADMNDNFLKDVACSHCGNRTMFRIEFSTLAEVTDYEVEHGDEGWKDDSKCLCVECGKPGKFEDFIIKGLDDLLAETAGLEEKDEDDEIED